jgi:hypothetical protein
MEETRASDRFSQVEKDLNHPEKPSHSVELEKNKSSGESFSKVLQDGTKVDKDINNKFLHGKPNKPPSPSETFFLYLATPVFFFLYSCKLLPFITCFKFVCCFLFVLLNNFSSCRILILWYYYRSWPCGNFESFRKRRFRCEE